MNWLVGCSTITGIVFFIPYNWALPSVVKLGFINIPLGANDSDIAPVFMAKKRLKENGVLNDVQLEIITKNTARVCDGYDISMVYLDMVLNDSISGLIGPPCSASGAVIGRLAVSYNMLLISYLTIKAEFANKDVYQTYGRTTLTAMSQFARVTVQYLKHFGWNRIGLLYIKSNLVDFLLPALREAIAMNGIEIAADIQYTSTNPQFLQYLQQLKQSCRIIIPVFGWHVQETYELMVAAEKANMTGPEYMWVQLQVAEFDEMEFDQKFAAAFSNTVLIQLEALNQENLGQFFQEAEQTYKEIFPERPNNSYDSNQYQPAMFDAAYMHGVALNLSVEAGIAHTDGKGLFNLLKWKRVEEGGTAPIIFDGDVERAPTYIVKYMNGAGSWSTCIKMDRQPNFTTGFYGFDVKFLISLHWMDHPPPDKPACGFSGEICDNSYTEYYIIGAAGVFLCLVICLIAYRQHNKKYERELMIENWRLDPEKLTSKPMMNFGSRSSLDGGVTGATDSGGFLKGYYDSNPIYFINYKKKKHFQFNRLQLLQLMKFKTITNQHLNKFLGFQFEDQDHLSFVWPFVCVRTLRDTLHNNDLTLDNDFKASFLRAVTHGMKYIHQSACGWHGWLTSDTCLVDSRFVVRLSQFGMTSLVDPLVTEGSLEIPFEKHDYLHMAPEMVIAVNQRNAAPGSQKADIYSLGMVLYQIITGMEVFESDDSNSLEILLAKVTDKSKPYRPSFPYQIDADWTQLVHIIRQCWEPEPIRRPYISIIDSAVSSVTKKFSGNIIEKMIVRMERYTDNLEKVVADRTNEVLVEREKTVKLLEHMLPKSVADRLQAGLPVLPEWFPESTILFTDIFNFTNLSNKRPTNEFLTFSCCTKLHLLNIVYSIFFPIVLLLNQMFGAFDEIIEKRNVYKVETIGDSYMIVSGVPHSTTDHARQIALLAIELRNLIKTFAPPFENADAKDMRLQIRLGVHSGPVAAGVVGLKMPRYCLFGDTVNTASIMKSQSKEMKIHVSAQTRDLLVNDREMNLKLRGTIHIKDKGVLTTYFLEKAVTKDTGTGGMEPEPPKDVEGHDANLYRAESMDRIVLDR